MGNNQEFKKRKLNKEQFEKEVNAAKIVKDGGKLVGAFAFVGVCIKKYGPSLMNAVKKIKL